MTAFLAIKLLFVGFTAIGVAVTAIERARKHGAIRRKMLAASRTFEDNALVTLTGTAKLIGAPLVAPLSGRACIAFRATARTYVLADRSGLFGRKRLALDQEVSEIVMTRFVLVTADGEIRVDGEVCELPIRGEAIIPRKLERERDFMVKAALIGLPQNAGFDEVVIPDGAKVMVHGIARREIANAGGETGFREAPTQIRITGDDAHAITIDLV